MITPHEYQREAVVALNESFETSNRALLVAPPGVGKTLKAAFWAAQHVGKGRGLFLCHENRILEQALLEFRQVLGEDVSLGVFHGERKEFDEVDICFASFQTFRRWKDAFFPDEFLFVIVDEGHHAAAPTFQPVVVYFTPRYLLGMTATPDRTDDRDIRDIFGPEVVNISLEDAIANGWLTPFEYHVVTDNLRTSTLRRLIREEFGENRRVSLAQLNESIFVALRDEQVAERILRLNKKTIIFCERIEHAEHFAEFIPGSKPYHTGRGHKENRETLQAFRDGTLQYILAVDKLNEGVDIPDAEVIVFYRNTDSERIFLQQLGRGARKQPGKEKYIVLDFVSNIHRLLALRKMVETIKHTQGGEQEEFDTSLIHLSGNGFDFRFTTEQLSVFEIVERMKPKFLSDYPALVREYSEKNPFPPEMVRAGTNIKLWWKCATCGHEWQALGNSRAYAGTGCPACANRVVTHTNNLAATHPELAIEYSERNELPADKVIAGTHVILWWKCSKCGHEWQTQGNVRAKMGVG
ncbi:MAG: zinc-ribbon domain-containing protein, partial [Patescibacteria group bacterium]|nr:zinc-ribbon domain-containing protein [Patescibacteria group bacterium]